MDKKLPRNFITLYQHELKDYIVVVAYNKENRQISNFYFKDKDNIASIITSVFGYLDNFKKL